MFYGTDGIMHNIPSFRLNVGNILQNKINPTKHCYGSDLCYEVRTVGAQL